MSATIRLHVKLYRARAIDEALRLAREAEPGIDVERVREGDYHVLRTSSEDKAAAELLAEIADAALISTVERERGS